MFVFLDVGGKQSFGEPDLEQKILSAKIAKNIKATLVAKSQAVGDVRQSKTLSGSAGNSKLTGVTGVGSNNVKAHRASCFCSSPGKSKTEMLRQARNSQVADIAVVAIEIETTECKRVSTHRSRFSRPGAPTRRSVTNIVVFFD
jgi:flagellar basal body L-ring protein FlgH